MRHVPEDIQSFYREQLATVEQSLHHNYVKWIRFYLDFCDKYRFVPYEKSSFSHFSQKLSDKKQTLNDIEEAFQAVQLLLPYYQAGLKEGELKSSRVVVQQLISVIRMKNYSPRTLEAYVKWTRQFLAFHNDTVDQIDDSTVRKFLNYLAVEKNVSPSAQNQAFNGLLFLFRHVLKRDMGDQSGKVRAKKPGKKIPVVLTVSEIKKLLAKIPAEYRLHFKLMYGCGLRLSELIELRLQDIDFENRLLRIPLSKQMKSRVVPLPKELFKQLKEHVDFVLNDKKEKEKNCSTYGGVFLPKGIAVGEALSNSWLWLFPASGLVTEANTGQEKQYHLHHSVLSKVLRATVKKLSLSKNVTPHVLRHSYATHLLIYGLDIRTVQELLGHKDINTTMVYLHVLKELAPRPVISPLDIRW